MFCYEVNQLFNCIPFKTNIVDKTSISMQLMLLKEGQVGFVIMFLQNTKNKMNNSLDVSESKKSIAVDLGGY